ncbi:MAG: alanine racemase [Bacteroidales bacterium]|nr:alanine racemase [Bacteroidales bacterium]MCF8343991.1 alanine racemase [Bacteroidales bacterium]MCF8350415.1 alanine racemase [Bacteroidales bacterium]
MLHTSYIELSKDALNSNINYIRKRIGKDVKYSMVVKANAYGHGIEELLPMIEECGVDHFSVFSVAEAMRAWEIKQEHCELMIMGFVDDDYLQWAIERDISFFVFTLHRLKKVIEVAKKMDQAARIHVELETGMHRTGFCEDEMEEVSRLLKKHSKHLEIEGICSHLAGAENIVNYRRITNQIERFKELCDWFGAEGFQPKYRHLACSAGVLNYPSSILDMVRVGISNYGFWPSDETKMMHMKEEGFEEDPLDRVLSWKTEIMSVNRVKEGNYVSYGKSYLTNRDSKIATAPVGYGYGFSRNLSNNGHILVKGKRVPVVGSVNMNMLVMDVTDVPDLKVGDEVVLIGKQGDAVISVGSFSDMNNSMNYELLTRLPNHIPRRIVP